MASVPAIKSARPRPVRISPQAQVGCTYKGEEKKIYILTVSFHDLVVVSTYIAGIMMGINTLLEISGNFNRTSDQQGINIR